MKKHAYMIPIYAYLVRVGKYAISEDEKTEGQKVVPEIYREDVALHIAEKEAFNDLWARQQAGQFPIEIELIHTPPN